jgi:hypothetical protein
MAKDKKCKGCTDCKCAKPEKQRYQIVVFTLSDGRTGRFVGRPFVDEKDIDDIKIVDIQFTEAQDLPEDCSWDDISKEK